MEFLILAALVVVYFLPGLIAYMRDHHNAVSITLLNLFLGWTLPGWVGALVWSASSSKTQ